MTGARSATVAPHPEATPLTHDDRTRIRAYHQCTKHAPQRYARSLGYMDWDTQPDPFRHFEGAPRAELPLAADALETRWSELFRPGAVAPRALDRASLAAFFELSLGLTAWKEFESSRWSLRADPSSGNLHPTEAYAILAEVPHEAGEGAAVRAGVHHYLSRDHVLERRATLDGAGAARLAQELPDGGFLVGVTSIHWREAWKYGERAFRYCQHDAGHVLGTLRYAAAALGWSATLVDGVADRTVVRLCGLDRWEDWRDLDPLDREHADLLVLVAPRHAAREAVALEPRLEALAELLAGAEWAGEPNELSSDHHPWDVIEEAADASRKERTEPTYVEPTGAPPCEPRYPEPDARAATLIRQRRSAVEMDGRTSMSADAFYAMLDRTLPRIGVPPFDVVPWTPRIHLGIFVHRVDGVAPGLYLFERGPDVGDRLRKQLGEEPLWTKPEGCPDHLRLACLTERNLRGTAATISCEQPIAGNGTFSLGMIADFRRSLEEGAHGYRRLFWEAGVVGQVLYLEAEAHGLRATGIGCYFDDRMHQALGLEDDEFQSLYHFTVGGPVEDERLVSHPAYAHLERERVEGR